MSTIIELFKNPVASEPLKPTIKAAVVEFLATTMFVFTGTLSAVSTGFHKDDRGVTDVARVLPIAMSFGIAILSLAHSIGHISGGHMNPGVSLLMFFRGQISFTKMILYWIAQFTGAMLGASIMWGSVSGIDSAEDIDRPPFLLGSTTLNPSLSHGNGFLIEFVGSFFFYFVIAQTALDKRGIASTPFPAIPIGLVLIAVHICLIPFTGCGVNPARTFGPSVVTCMASSDLCKAAIGDWYWIYYIGPFVAAFCVAEVTNFLACCDGGEDESGDSVKEVDSPDVSMTRSPDADA